MIFIYFILYISICGVLFFLHYNSFIKLSYNTILLLIFLFSNFLWLFFYKRTGNSIKIIDIIFSMIVSLLFILIIYFSDKVVSSMKFEKHSFLKFIFIFNIIVFIFSFLFIIVALGFYKGS